MDIYHVCNIISEHLTYLYDVHNLNCNKTYIYIDIDIIGTHVHHNSYLPGTSRVKSRYMWNAHPTFNRESLYCNVNPYCGGS